MSASKLLRALIQLEENSAVMRHVTPVVPFAIQPTIATIQKDHIIQLLLCADLEHAADRLPAPLGLAELSRISDTIACVTSVHFARAEQVLQALPRPQRPPQSALDTLCQMHVLDEMHGQDLVTALGQYVGASSRADVGQLAYMLRCFFDGCRRAISLKESFITFARHEAVRSG